MKRNKVSAILLGVVVITGAIIPLAMPATTTYAAAITEQVIGHGEWRQENGKWYYYQDGKMLKNCWVKDGIDWYMLNEDGTMEADELIKIDNDVYYFRDWGGMLYDKWHEDLNGNRYYFRSWGGALNTGWMQLSGSWYYFDKETCVAHVKSLEKIDNDLYAFDETGKMLHDTWYTDENGDRYYLRNWGGALNTGWMQLSGNWYYFDKETCVAHVKSLEKIDNDLYAFDETGKMLHDCWLEVDGVNYYFRGWGGAMHDQTAVIDGKEYVFDSIGNGTLKEVTTPDPEPTVTPEPTDTPEEVVEATELYVYDTNGEDKGTTLTSIGETSQLTVAVLPENATDKTVTWWSDNPEIVTVDQNGQVTAISEGWTHVYAKTANGCVDNTVVEVTLPKTDEDYLNEVTYDAEMSRQVFDLVNQQRVLEGHLEMEWSDGFDKDQAIAVAANNLLRYLKQEDDLDSLSDHNGSQNGAGGAKYNLTAEDIFNMWMESPAHKSNQMNDSVKSAAYAVMYKKGSNGEYLFSAICTLSFTGYDPEAEKDFIWNGDPYMDDFMTEDTYNMILTHFE